MTKTSHATIMIRPAYADDRSALARLAAVDSAEVPTEPLLLAEVDEQLRAALSVTDGSVIADPFFPTRDLIELLRTRAAAVDPRRATRRNRRQVRRFRPHLASG
jgi:hypothetical protein